MQYYTEDLIQALNETSNCNFIACAITFLQAIGINASIKKMVHEGIKLHGFVLIMAHPSTGRILKESDFMLSGADIKVIFYCDKYKNGSKSPLRNRLIALRESKNPKQNNYINILWTNVDYKWYGIFSKVKYKSQLRFILIDDGDGSYIDQFSNFYYDALYQKGSTLLNIFLTIIKIHIIKSFHKALLQNISNNKNLVDNRIFHVEKSKGYILNAHISDYYKISFREQANKIDKNILMKLENAVLFNTQCLYENKMSDGKKDFELYRLAIKQAKLLGLKIALKPHPRELNLQKYVDLGIDIIPANISQEALLANLKKGPLCVVSIFSSTLLNAYGLFNIPVISMAKIFKNDKMSSALKSQLDDYIKRHEKGFIFPETLEEFNSTLKKICSK